MPDPAATAHTRLLVRARRGLENPASLDDAARYALIADLAVAERLLGASQLPAPVSLPMPRGRHLEAGRYCVLGTAHLTLATADLLDKWSSKHAQHRLLDIAGCIHGWFVPTREIDRATRRLLPADLLAVMQFARDHGFNHILFDCDAGTVDGLAVHCW